MKRSDHAASYSVSDLAARPCSQLRTSHSICPKVRSLNFINQALHHLKICFLLFLHLRLSCPELLPSHPHHSSQECSRIRYKWKQKLNVTLCDVCRSKCKSIWISKDWYLNAQTHKHCSIVNTLRLCGALSHFICFYTFQILCSLCAKIFGNTSSNNLWFIMKWIHVSKVLWKDCWMNEWLKVFTQYPHPETRFSVASEAPDYN